MQPDVAPGGDGRNRTERIDGAEIGGSGRRDDRHGCLAFGDRPVDCVFQRFRIHPPVAIGRDEGDGVRREAENVGALGDAEMRAFGSEDHTPQTALSPQPFGREVERGHVRLGSATGETAAGNIRQAANACEPCADLLLDHGRERRLIPGIEGLVSGRNDCFGGKRRHRDRAVKMRHGEGRSYIQGIGDRGPPDILKGPRQSRAFVRHRVDLRQIRSELGGMPPGIGSVGSLRSDKIRNRAKRITIARLADGAGSEDLGGKGMRAPAGIDRGLQVDDVSAHAAWRSNRAKAEPMISATRSISASEMTSGGRKRRTQPSRPPVSRMRPAMKASDWTMRA